MIPVTDETAGFSALCVGTKSVVHSLSRPGMGGPQHDDKVLFEFLILKGAQAGLSWETILAKRENFRAAFAQFDPAVVAQYDRRKVRGLLSNSGA